MFSKILQVRYVFLIAVIFTFLNSLFFLIGGVIESIHGYRLFFEHGLDGEYRPGAYLLKGLDLFLVGLVFLIFALGIMRIFTHYNSTDENLPAWLRISDFKELKILLWETVIVTLVIFTLTEIVTSKQSLKLDALILPGVILMLTLSLFLMKRNDKH
jgi:uncharacterized membrane protein YqhA